MDKEVEGKVALVTGSVLGSSMRPVTALANTTMLTVTVDTGWHTRAEDGRPQHRPVSLCAGCG